MRQNDDGKTVAAMDMLVPRVMLKVIMPIYLFTFQWECVVFLSCNFLKELTSRHQLRNSMNSWEKSLVGYVVSNF